jgi:hypothetical protein
LLNIKLLIFSIFSSIFTIWDYSCHLFLYKKATLSIYLLTHKSIKGNIIESIVICKMAISILYEVPNILYIIDLLRVWIAKLHLSIWI